MFDISTFLLRWMFLSNLTRDIADLQTIPQQAPQHMQQQQQQQHLVGPEGSWRDYTLTGILQYPAGIQRALSLDAMRLELVQQLEVKMMADDATLLFQKERRSSLSNDNNAQTIPHGTLSTNDPPSLPSLDQIRTARRSHHLVREYLPQLVSAILHSPPTLGESSFPALAQLRTVVLNRCRDDPAFGIELCWLLEAQVGRTWKTLFEHVSQKKRLIVVSMLPAEKAALLAKIGRGKREAFDFLQQAEQATAYGVLPSSLSERRCAHFGDTMHWMDRLSKLSSDLRLVPESLRKRVLYNELSELNRRIRRRMVTRGCVSLDVEDNLGPQDWPGIDDMSLDVIDHSIHLPLMPQTGVWPDGLPPSSADDEHEEDAPDQVVRVLNIVVPESRILSSRERCPFLVHVEVADSGLEASDARLYTAGTTGLGATLGEALGTAGAAVHLGTSPGVVDAELSEREPSFSVPRELVKEHQLPVEQDVPVPIHAALARGGSHVDPSHFHNFDGTGPFADPSQVQNDENNRLPYTAPHAVWSQQQQQQQQEPYERAPHEYYNPQQIDGQSQDAVQKVGAELLDGLFGPEWATKCQEVREASPYGHVKGWRLASFIIKAGEDIRRESFVMQIISKLKGWFEDEIPDYYRPFLRPYTIMCVGADSGLLECLSDAKSVDEIKKETEGFVSLRDYFERAYGPPRANRLGPALTSNGQIRLPLSYPAQTDEKESGTSPRRIISFEEAQDNFLRSLVGYSLVCYILQVKDRHNANILMSRLGHIMHIDFGFVLGDTPKMGKVPIFTESAPFKLNTEFWEVLGGWKGLGVKFCRMFELAFTSASRHVDEIASLTEASMLSMGSTARHARIVANGVRSRLRMRGPPRSRQQQQFIADLVNTALTSWGTNTYDWLQRNMNGYL